MTEEKILNILARTIPQFYVETHTGMQEQHTLKSNNAKLVKTSTRKFTSKLTKYIEACLSAVPDLSGVIDKNSEDFVSEEFAKKWLTIKTGANVDWGLVLGYFYSLSQRTNENDFVRKNLKIDINANDDDEKLSLFDERFFKAIDLIGGSPSTFLRVNKKLQVIATESIEPTSIPHSDSYTFYPDFMRTLAESCTNNEILLTLTNRGDLLVCYQKQLICSKRKGRWTIYEPESFKNAIWDFVSPSTSLYGLACTLYGILWDLSYRRHGGLVIIDSPENFKKYTDVYNDFHKKIDSTLPPVSFDNIKVETGFKRLLLEFTSVDGSVLVSKDNGKLIGFGKNVFRHEKCPSFFGARTSAAYSAALHGGIVFKVSSDGDITLLKLVDSKFHILNYI